MHELGSANTPAYQSANEIWSTYLHHFQRYDWGKILKTGHVTLTTPLLRVIIRHMLGFDIDYDVQNLITLASAIPEILLVPTKI